jgi:hypothetical protein
MMKKYGDDIEVKKHLNGLQEIEKTVFDEKNPSIPHIVCDDIPEGLDEEMYLKVYRKQMAVFRHKIYMYMKNEGSGQVKEQHMEAFAEITKEKTEF